MHVAPDAFQRSRDLPGDRAFASPLSAAGPEGGKGAPAPSMYAALCREVPDFRARRVLVMGLGAFGGGVGIARFLASRGAYVTVTDTKSEDELKGSLESLRGLPIHYTLGRHEEKDFRSCDLLVPSPAVPPDHPLVRLAIDRGVPVETEMNLFFKLCRARTILGVTGSNGKTTTVSLTYRVLRALHGDRVWIGGNVGISLLEHVERIREEDIVVLELSSFQLEALHEIRRSPTIAVITNVTPNHLDRHGSMAAYLRAKQRIVEHQRPGDISIVDGDDPKLRELKGAGRRVEFSFLNPPAEGAWTCGETIYFRSAEDVREIDIRGRRLPGLFNIQNMMAATCASYAAWKPGGAGGSSGRLGWAGVCSRVFRSFPGVEHRLEFVVESAGVRYYNDSIATNPEATIAALDALPGPFVLILGGVDKDLPFDRLARVIARRPVRRVVLTGRAAPKIRAALEAAGVAAIAEEAAFERAVQAARRFARPGDQVLLSPACASYDQFPNFVARGLRFKHLVSAA